MNKKSQSILALTLLVTSISMTACAPMHYQPSAGNNPNCVNNTNVAAGIAGAVIGGVIGSRFGNGGGKTAATVTGVAGGALLGNSMGCQ